MSEALFTVPDLGTFKVWSNSGTDVGLSTVWGYKNQPEVSETVRLSRVDYGVNFFMYREGHREIDPERIGQGRTREYRGWHMKNEQLFRVLTRPNTGGDPGTAAAGAQCWKLIVEPFIDWLLDTDEGKQFLADTRVELNNAVAEKATKRAYELHLDAQRLERIALDAVAGKPLTAEDESFALYGKDNR